ncbi:MAG: ABC transporter substrate-binding protein, partial [Oscillospiraceae bacterium]|nr:ABC transporter substrate-binding protein [Oscillospiraceae bacterium]
MKRYLAIILALCLALSVFAGCAKSGAGSATTPTPGADTGDKAPGDKVLKIGIFEPASGDNGAAGKQEALGYIYANSLQPTVQIAGETYTVVFERVDNESSTDKAATAASTLISKGVSSVLGSYGSAVCIASSDVFAQAKIPVLAPTSTNP